MTPKQRLEALANKLEAQAGFVSEDVDVCRAALREIERLEALVPQAPGQSVLDDNARRRSRWEDS